MTSIRKSQYLGQVKLPGRKPQNVDLSIRLRNSGNMIQVGGFGSDDIQRAFGTAKAGYTIIFPPGVYSVTAASSMSGIDNVSIVGYGAILRESSGALSSHLAFTSCDNLSIQGINFEAGENDTYFQANSPTTGRAFIDLTSCNDSSIRGVTGVNKRNLITADSCLRLKISDFSFTGFAGTLASPNTSSNANFLWCIDLINCDYASVVGGQVMEHGSAVLSQTTSTHLTISNISGKDLHDNGIYISSGTNIGISNNSFLDVVGDGIQVRGEKITITGNILDNCDDFGIAATPLSGANGSVVITGNHVNNCELGIRCIANASVEPVDVIISNNVVFNCTSATDNGCIEANSQTGRLSICGNIVRTAAGDNGIFVPDVGTTTTHVVICGNIVSDINGSATSSRGAIRMTDADEFTIADNVMHDIDSGIGVRLNACTNGTVSGNVYDGGQVVRIPTAESNTGIIVTGNRGSTIVVDGDNNVIGQNYATITGYPASSTTPLTTGQITIDTGEAYIATGVASSSDWQQITP